MSRPNAHVNTPPREHAPNTETPITVTLLGTGTSTGVPVIGCSCRVCQSDDPRDVRMRCSCYIEAGDVGLLIDVGPDFRRQALRFGLRRLDAVLFTHSHFDHVVGLDDLRPFFFHNEAPIPCFTRRNTAMTLRRMFPYVFLQDDYDAAPHLTLREITGSFEVESRHDASVPPVTVQPLDLLHGDLPVCGYRIGRFAYLTDASTIPERTYDRLQDLDVLVLDALRHKEHPRHFSIEEATAAARRIGARQTYFTHLTHSVVHAEEEARLPDGIDLAYDGLRFTVDFGL